MAAATTDLEKEFGKLTVSQPTKEVGVCKTTLPIISTRKSKPPSFTGHTLIGCFRISEDKSYKAGVSNRPKLVSSSRLASLTGADLRTGFPSVPLALPCIVTDERYQERKQDYFLKWLIDNEYFTKVDERKYAKPDFICFRGRITYPMMSPVKPGKHLYDRWDIYATKSRDVIYLWEDKTIRKGAGDGKMNLRTYDKLRFLHLLKGVDWNASSPIDDKILGITEVKFGTHQLLVLNRVDAQDKTGALVELKLHNKCSPKANGMWTQYLKYWAKSIVPGVEKLVIGQCDGRHLLSIKSVAPDKLARKQKIDTGSCLDFEDRLLNWIKKCFKNAEDGSVKKFTWICGEPAATVTNVEKCDVPERLLPDWFADKVGEMMDRKEAEKPGASSPNSKEEDMENKDGEPEEEDKENQDDNPWQTVVKPKRKLRPSYRPTL